MAAKTEAQEEFDNLFVSKGKAGGEIHSEDRNEKEEGSEADEETLYNNEQIDAAMRMPVYERNGGRGLRLPDKSFDNGGRTGVKGVIADARSYEEARKAGRIRNTNTITRSSMRQPNGQSTFHSRSESEDEKENILDDDEDDEEFLNQWRASRKLEIAREVGNGNDIRTRRTSPSVRRYGRFDEVDMLGYLDAIEKVGRDTVVVVLVYDHEVPYPSALFSLMY